MKKIADNFAGAITICNEDFVITYMNNKSKETFQNESTGELIGTNLFDCHKDDSIKKIMQIKENKSPNVYTIEKNGIKKLIYQYSIFEDNIFKGMIELSLEIPFEMPHFKRD